LQTSEFTSFSVFNFRQQGINHAFYYCSWNIHFSSTFLQTLNISSWFRRNTKCTKSVCLKNIFSMVWHFSTHRKYYHLHEWLKIGNWIYWPLQNHNYKSL
jgi:hypothetical protein